MFNQQNDLYQNLINMQLEPANVTFGQGNSFGQKQQIQDANRISYLENRNSNPDANRVSYLENRNSSFAQTNEIWKSSFNQEQDNNEYQYPLEQYNFDQPYKNLEGQFEMKFEELQLQDQLDLQCLVKKSKSMIEVEEKNSSCSKNKIKPILNFEIENADQISKKFKPEIRNISIMNENSDLFNVKKSNSIYTNKITQLFDKPSSLSISPRSSKSQSKYERKVSTKTIEKDTDYSSLSMENVDQVSKLSQDPLLQKKLFKNRESARNSRQRKKIYFDLLEIKIADISKECERLKDLCRNQNKEIQQQNQDLKQIKEFFDQQQILFSKLDTVIGDGKIPEQQQSELNLVLDALRFRSSSNTKERIFAGMNFISDMVNISLPDQSRYILQSAETSKDLFYSDFPCFFDWSAEMFSGLQINPNQIQLLSKLKTKIKQNKINIESYIELIKEQLSKINSEAMKLDFVMDQMRIILTPLQMAQILQCIHHNSFRTELQTVQIFQNLRQSQDDDQEFQFEIQEQEYTDPLTPVKYIKLCKMD